MNRFFWLILSLSFLSVSCGGGSSSDMPINSPSSLGTSESSIQILGTEQSYEGRFFGQGFEVLSNGAIVIVNSDYDQDDNIVIGTARLYDSQLRLVNEFTSLVENDPVAYVYISSSSAIPLLPSHSITSLENDNFLIASLSEDIDGAENAGSIRVVSGETGSVVSGRLVGNESRLFGFFVEPLKTGNVLIGTPYGTSNGELSLLDSATGQRIGQTFFGEFQGDRLGLINADLPSSRGIRALENGNALVISSSHDGPAGTNEGAVFLIDGETGLGIGDKYYGGAESRHLGNAGDIELNNGNVILFSNSSDLVTNSRCAINLINSTTGDFQSVPILENIDVSGICHDITHLKTENIVFAIQTRRNKVIYMVDTQRSQVLELAVYEGEPNFEIVSLLNGNFTVSVNLSESDRDTIVLHDGNTGEQIGEPLNAQNNDSFLKWNIVPLLNGNYVASNTSISSNEDMHIDDIFLLDGNTNQRLGSTIVTSLRSSGRLSPKHIFSINREVYAFLSIKEDGKYLELVNATDNSVYSSSRVTTSTEEPSSSPSLSIDTITDSIIGVRLFFDDVEGQLKDAGSVTFINVLTGDIVGESLYGNTEFGNFGQTDWEVTVLNERLMLIVDDARTINNTPYAGSAFIYDYISGQTLGASFDGRVEGDFRGFFVKHDAARERVVLSLPSYSNTAGRVLIFNYGDL